jgi:hypothetical protein
MGLLKLILGKQAQNYKAIAHGPNYRLSWVVKDYDVDARSPNCEPPFAWHFGQVKLTHIFSV